VTRYSYSWTASADTIPDTVGETNTTGATSPPLGDGNNWHFHVRTKDQAGNWNPDAAHKGPFRIDTNAPSNPTTSAETHGAPRDTWQSSIDDPDFTWSGASDGEGSGIAGYHVYWGTDPSGTSTIWTTNARYDPPAVSTPGADLSPQPANAGSDPSLSGPHTYYLRVQTKDHVGHASPWKTLFTFKYDGSAPTNPTSCDEDHGAPQGTWQNSIDDPAFTWSGATDGTGSGIDGYHVYWGTDPAGTNGIWTTDPNYDPPPVPDPSVHYLRVATQDHADNSSPWKTLFTFKYDAAPPSNPTTLWSSSHTVGAWSPDNTIDMAWSGASDGEGSGVTRYSYSWTTSPDTIPDAAGESADTNVTSPPLDDGDNWYFHVRTRDQVGNWNDGAAHKGPFRIDTNAPSGSLSIDHGSACTNDPSITLGLTASDQLSGVSQLQLRYAGVDHDWEPYVATKAIQLGGPDGVKWVSARYQDRAGNFSEWYTSNITLDRTAPTSQVAPLPPNQTATSFLVAWPGQDPDPGCGIASYDVQFRVTGNAQWQDWLIDTPLTSSTFGPIHPTVLRDGQTYYFRSNASDVAGNLEAIHSWDGDTSTTIHLLGAFLPLITK